MKMIKQKVSITFADNKVRMKDHIDRLVEAINSAGVKSKKDSGLEVTDLKFSPDCSSAIVSIMFQGDEGEERSIRCGGFHSIYAESILKCIGRYFMGIGY